MAPFFRGGWAFGPGGRGPFGFQGGAWDLLSKVGAGPPWDPPKVTYESLSQFSEADGNMVTFPLTACFAWISMKRQP